VHVDVAQRRDQVHYNLTRTYLDRPRNRDEPKSPDSRSPTSPEPTTAPSSPEQATAGAERIGLSPVIEASAVETMFPGASPVTGESHVTPGTERAKNSLLKQVLILRDSDSQHASATPKVPEDLLSEVNDAETVQFFLGQTPVLPSENFAPPVPLLPQAEEEFDFPDGRSSICPDDSVSVIFTRKMNEREMERPPPLPLSLDTQQAVSYTVDSAARSQINRVLEHYQEGSVTPAQAQHYKEQTEELTPNMAQYANWDSIEETKQHLASVVNGEADEAPVQTPTSTTSRSTSRPHSILEDLEDDDDYRGTAIIFTNGRYVTTLLTRTIHKSRNLCQEMQSTNTANRPSALSPQTDSTATPARSWHTPMESLASPSPHDRSRSNSFARPFSSNSAAPKDGLGLTMTSDSPEMPMSPLPPTSDTSAGATSGTKPGTQRIDTQMALRQGSWGLPSSPAPKDRPRRGTEDNGSNRDSRTSKRSLALSPNYSVSPDQNGNLTDRSSANTASEETDAMKQKAEKKLKDRWNFLKELIDTEHSYFHDMTIGVDIFLATAPHVSSLTYEDRRLIFGNIEKIRDLANKVLEALKKSVHTVYRVPPENRFHIKRGGSTETGRDSNGTPTGYRPEKDVHAMMDRETTVGATFCQLAPEMDRLFKYWMIHSEKSNRRIQQVKKDPEVKMWLEECYNSAKDITNAWDLDSLLVKPTQRYMKYPLLLTGILGCTPPEHPDHDYLARALKLIETSVTGINEEKRRREVATELLSQKKGKESANRINLRQFAMFGRQNRPKTRQASQSVQAPANPHPASIPTDDDSYEIVRQKFGGHFFQLQIVMRDFEKYLEDMRINLNKMTAYSQALESSYRFDMISRFPEQESRIHQYVEVVSSIQRYMLPEHIKAVEKHVITPVRKLWQLHDKPQVLMVKHRKLKPQFQKYAKEKDKEKVNEKVRTEGEQYIALNQVLKDELPQLYRLTGEIVQACLQNFLEIQSRWESMWVAKLKPFTEDRDLVLYHDADYDEFLTLTQDEFFHEFDNVELDVQSMATTSGNLAAAIAAAEKGRELRWYRDDPNTPDKIIEGHERPSTSSKASKYSASGLGTGTASARGSVEQANRSTPNLNMGIISPNPSTTPHRRSYNNALSPLPHSNAFADGGTAGYFAGIASAPVSGGPNTPVNPINSAQPTPGLPPPNTRQWFESDWANATTNDALNMPAAMSNTDDMRHFQRGMDGIAVSHHVHGAEQLSQKYPPLSYYDQIMQSQSYHSRHHSNTPAATTATHLNAPDAGSSNLPSPRYSGIFHSALPADMAEDEAELLPSGSGDVRVLFIVASLFEFHIDSNRREAGYPYLTYVAGEIFEIVGQRGELWLARNQDDSDGTLGWIWEKHFALLPMEPQ
jgi:dynamin-binding protein